MLFFALFCFSLNTNLLFKFSYFSWHFLCFLRFISLNFFFLPCSMALRSTLVNTKILFIFVAPSPNCTNLFTCCVANVIGATSRSVPAVICYLSTFVLRSSTLPLFSHSQCLQSLFYSVSKLA